MSDQDRHEVSAASRASRMGLGKPRIVWAGRTLWLRTYTVGGYDGYRTITGRRLPCAEVERLWRQRNVR